METNPKKRKRRRRFLGKITYFRIFLFSRIFSMTDRKLTIYGKGALFAFVFSMFFINLIQYTLIFQISVIMFAFLANGLIWTIYFRPKITVRRLISKYCTADNTMEYSIIVENYGKRWERGLFFMERPADPIPKIDEFIYNRESFGRKGKKKFPKWKWFVEKNTFLKPYENIIPDIGPGEKKEIKVSLKTIKRGVLHLDGYFIIKKDPFSLMRRMLFFKEEINVISLPKIYNTDIERISEVRKYNQGGIVSAIKVGNSEEFISLREYKPGDIIKRMHWKSFAKTQKPVVKEFSDEFFSRYGLILDTFSEKTYNENFEAAVSVAASVIYGIELGDSLIDLMFLGTEKYIFTGGRGVVNQEKMLEILSAVSTNKSEDIEPLMEMVRSHIALMSGVMVIFIDMDENRKKLVEMIKENNINLKVILICDNVKKMRKKIKKIGVEFHVIIMDSGNMGDFDFAQPPGIF